MRKLVVAVAAAALMSGVGCQKDQTPADLTYDDSKSCAADQKEVLGKVRENTFGVIGCLPRQTYDEEAVRLREAEAAQQHQDQVAPTKEPVDGVVREGASTEDSPGWDWKTQGNKMHGICVDGEDVLEHADGSREPGGRGCDAE